VGELYAELTRTGGGAPAVGDPAQAAPLDDGTTMSLAMAQRLDRLKREQQLLGYLNGGEGGLGTSLFEAQLLGAFGPEQGEG
jgi:hypothetical protein